MDVAGQTNWAKADRNLYVVELRAMVFEKKRKFFEGNPHWVPGKLCVYVGMTGLTPGERLREHRNGNHSARFVKKYGLRLLPELFNHFNPMPYALATVMEVELAR